MATAILISIYGIGAIAYLIFAIWYNKQVNRRCDETYSEIEHNRNIMSTAGICVDCQDKRGCPYRKRARRNKSVITNCDLFIGPPIKSFTDASSAKIEEMRRAITKTVEEIHADLASRT